MDCFAGKMEKFQEHVLNSELIAPLVAAVESAIDSFLGDDIKSKQESSQPSSNATTPVPAPTPAAPPTTAHAHPAEFEEQMMQEAIKLSLEDSTQTASAPMLSFVRDVTFPDNSSVLANTQIQKIWCVRNTGQDTWRDMILVPAGGDALSPLHAMVSLPTLAPGEEANIAVDIIAPATPGLYTAYYRAQTMDGNSFGHRLWASIVVVDPIAAPALSSPVAEADWHVVNASASATAAAAAAAGTTEAPSVADAAATAAVVATALPAPRSPATASVDPVLLLQREGTVESKEEMVEPSEPAQRSAQLQSLALLWRREIEILHDMGFHDMDMMLPLLQTHLACPLSLSAEKNGTPRMEGMQLVIAALLSQGLA
jgi:hypothetical protein